jgi:probable F420-dependent oxidoreductase
MKFGLHSVNLHTCGYPDAAARIGRAAEAAGFESLWVADHVVLPDPPVAGRPMAPDQRLLDPIVALTFLAAHTQRIRLATGVIILPQRQALVLAKQLASLDVLSNGRLIFGLGVGWCEPEMRSVGAPFAERGRVADDYLAAMRAVWTQAQAVVSRPVRGVRRGAGDAAPGADARAHRGRRAHGAGLPARRDPGPRLVRLRDQRRGHAEDRRHLARLPPRSTRGRPSSDGSRSA